MERADWRQAFDAFTAKKSAAAVAAHLPPYVTDVCRPSPSMLAVGSEWTRRLFDGPFYAMPAQDPARPACSLVFVQSLHGNTVTRDPASLGGGATDTHLIYEGLSRVGCDGVLAGAQTVRGSQMVFSVWHPELVRLRAALGLPRHPVQVVASRSAMNLDRELVFNVPEMKVVLLTSPDGWRSMAPHLHVRPWITVLALPHADALPAAFSELRGLGIERLSCIGGRTLAAALADAGLVDELYLTTGTRSGGEPHTSLPDDLLRGSVVLRKHGSGDERGVVFEHLAFRR